MLKRLCFFRLKERVLENLKCFTEPLFISERVKYEVISSKGSVFYAHEGFLGN